jgi:hypothetical protein
MRLVNTTNPIAMARRRIWNEINADPGYKLGWIANLAMFMYDNLDDDRLKDQAFREKIAERLIKLVFG